MKITVIGTGFVGVVTAAVFASFGNEVVGLDIDEAKIANLTNGQAPFYEPDLEELLVSEQQAGRLKFTTDYQQAVTGAEIIIIAVGTPSTKQGKADLSFVESAAKSLAPHLSEDAIVVVKSTIPPGSLDIVESAINQETDINYYLASVPEFLREGSAVTDTLNPDRVILGATEPEVFTRLEQLHQPLRAPVVRMSPESAQMTKYAANAYLATRITFINELADLCEQNQADIEDVIEGIGYDKRIGDHYWYPGFGYGGSCFPKDVRELAYYSREVGLEDNLLNKINQINQERIHKVMQRIEGEVGDFTNKTVAVLGLSFKPNTDDTREAPSTKVIPWLLDKGAEVKAFDPKANETAQKVLPDSQSLTFNDSIEAALSKAEVIMVLIEWPAIIEYDYRQARNEDKEQWIIDARNQLNKSELEQAGFKYIGIGR